MQSPPPPPPRCRPPRIRPAISSLHAHAHVCAYVAGVKDAVVDAVEELYLKAPTGGVADPCQAAQNLVALAQGSSLGQSACLEPRPVLVALLCVPPAGSHLVLLCL